MKRKLFDIEVNESVPKKQAQALTIENSAQTNKTEVKQESKEPKKTLIHETMEQRQLCEKIKGILAITLPLIGGLNMKTNWAPWEHQGHELISPQLITGFSDVYEKVKGFLTSLAPGINTNNILIQKVDKELIVLKKLVTNQNKLINSDCEKIIPKKVMVLNLHELVKSISPLPEKMKLGKDLMDRLYQQIERQKEDCRQRMILSVPKKGLLQPNYKQYIQACNEELERIKKTREFSGYKSSPFFSSMPLEIYLKIVAYVLDWSEKQTYSHFRVYC